MQTLQELAEYIRKTLPQASTIANLTANDQAGVVEFGWQSRHFVVRTSLEVMEKKDKNLYITGASMLMQAAFMTRNANQKVIEGIVNTLQQVEDTVKRDQPRGLSLLQSAKQSVARLAGKSLKPAR
jgi:hypothetical protein